MSTLLIDRVKRYLNRRAGWTDDQLQKEFRLTMLEARNIRQQLVAEGLLAGQVDRYNRHVVIK